MFVIDCIMSIIRILLGHIGRRLKSGKNYSYFLLTFG